MKGIFVSFILVIGFSIVSAQIFLSDTNQQERGIQKVMPRDLGNDEQNESVIKKCKSSEYSNQEDALTMERRYNCTHKGVSHGAVYGFCRDLNSQGELIVHFRIFDYSQFASYLNNQLGTGLTYALLLNGKENIGIGRTYIGQLVDNRIVVVYSSDSLIEGEPKVNLYQYHFVENGMELIISEGTMPVDFNWRQPRVDNEIFHAKVWECPLIE